MKLKTSKKEKKGVIIGSGWKRANGCIGFLISKRIGGQELTELTIKPNDSLLVAPRKKEKDKDPDFVLFAYTEGEDSQED